MCIQEVKVSQVDQEIKGGSHQILNTSCCCCLICGSGHRSEQNSLMSAQLTVVGRHDMGIKRLEVR
jgi:hypothetical protein